MMRTEQPPAPRSGAAPIRASLGTPGAALLCWMLAALAALSVDLVQVPRPVHGCFYAPSALELSAGQGYAMGAVAALLSLLCGLPLSWGERMFGVLLGAIVAGAPYLVSYVYA